MLLMDCAFGGTHWQELFDVVVFNAKKPQFWTVNNPCYGICLCVYCMCVSGVRVSMVCVAVISNFAVVFICAYWCVCMSMACVRMEICVCFYYCLLFVFAFHHACKCVFLREKIKIKITHALYLFSFYFDAEVTFSSGRKTHVSSIATDSMSLGKMYVISFILSCLICNLRCVYNHYVHINFSLHVRACVEGI